MSLWGSVCRLPRIFCLLRYSLLLMDKQCEKVKGSEGTVQGLCNIYLHIVLYILTYFLSCQGLHIGLYLSDCAHTLWKNEIFFSNPLFHTCRVLFATQPSLQLILAHSWLSLKQVNGLTLPIQWALSVMVGMWASHPIHKLLLYSQRSKEPDTPPIKANE